MRELRIHGDNVVECERALSLLAESLSVSFVVQRQTQIVAPKFVSQDQRWSVHLLPGHGRWGLDVAGSLKGRGATVRENADAVISEELSTGEERLLVALEFCGALPAGNNAWQRHGRALGFGQAGVPYLIFNEIGGLELGPERKPKASRLPNPVVPYSLIQFSEDSGSIVLPVYEPAPSAPTSVKERFGKCFGGPDSHQLIREIIEGNISEKTVGSLRKRAQLMVDELSKSRKRSDGFTEDQWRSVFEAGSDRLENFAAQGLTWTRSGSLKVDATKTARNFMSSLNGLETYALGSAALPFFVVPTASLDRLAKTLEGSYGSEVRDCAAWVRGGNQPVVMVLVTGFKPQGDDSRPDRGLAPLARMLAGPSARLLSFIWGPGKPGLLRKFRDNPSAACAENGLIEAVASCSSRVLVDSVNTSPFVVDTSDFKHVANHGNAGLIGKPEIPSPGEHDVDSAFHFLISQPRRPWVFEGMCNPPGGDWSGISISLENHEEVRWTSLPRVSSSGAKRPDHVVQIRDNGMEYIYSVESKQTSQRMEPAIGPMLVRYTDDLFAFSPTIWRANGSDSWTEFDGEIKSWSYQNVSVGLYVHRTHEELEKVLDKSDLDIVAAFEFSNGDLAGLHMLSRSRADQARRVLRKAVESSSFDIKVREY